jgi:hypothetical protein
VLESGVLRALHNVERHDLYFGDEMGGTCGTNEAVARIGVCWQDLKARDGLGGRMILKLVLNMEKEKAQTGIVLDRDRDRWWAVVNAVMNLRLP